MLLAGSHHKVAASPMKVPGLCPYFSFKLMYVNPTWIYSVEEFVSLFPCLIVFVAANIKAHSVIIIRV
jgi:hypothetical protein